MRRIRHLGKQLHLEDLGIEVPVQTPAALPLDTSISDVKINPHRRLSYQPSDNADHSNRCTRTGDGSMPLTSAFLIAASVAAVSLVESAGGTWDDSSEINVRMVCNGSSGSQVSI